MSLKPTEQTSFLLAAAFQRLRHTVLHNHSYFVVQNLLQQVSDQVPLQHFERLACIPKISYDKKAEENNKNPLKF